MLLSLDISVLFLALPHLSADLGASSTEQLWVSDVYGFMLAGFLVTMGTLGDRIGRRRLLLTGARSAESSNARAEPASCSDGAIAEGAWGSWQRDVHVSGGAQTISRAVAGGLVKEFHLRVAPVGLGTGVRLFEILPAPIDLEAAEVIHSPWVIHIRDVLPAAA
jgi:hypothetical protein